MHSAGDLVNKCTCVCFCVCVCVCWRKFVCSQSYFGVVHVLKFAYTCVFAIVIAGYFVRNTKGAGDYIHHPLKMK